MPETHWGVGSLAPILVTLLVAFKSRSALFALFVGCIVGVVMTGIDPARGFDRRIARQVFERRRHRQSAQRLG